MSERVESTESFVNRRNRFAYKVQCLFKVDTYLIVTAVNSLKITLYSREEFGSTLCCRLKIFYAEVYKILFTSVLCKPKF